MLRASLVLTALVAAAPSFAAAKIVGIDVRPANERVDVVVKASEPLTFQSWARSSPPVLVIDLLDTVGEAKTLTPGGAIEQIAVTRHDARGQSLSRLSLNLRQSM